MVLGLQLQITPRQRVVDTILLDAPRNKYRQEEYHFQLRPQHQNQHLYNHLDSKHHIQQLLHHQLQMQQLKASSIRFHFLQRLIQNLLHVGDIVSRQHQGQRTSNLRSRSFRTTSSQASIWAR